MIRRVQFWGIPELGLRWWGDPTELPPPAPAGHVWFLVGQCEVPE